MPAWPFACGETHSVISFNTDFNTVCKATSVLCLFLHYLVIVLLQELSYIAISYLCPFSQITQRLRKTAAYVESCHLNYVV